MTDLVPLARNIVLGWLLIFGMVAYTVAVGVRNGTRRVTE